MPRQCIKQATCTSCGKSDDNYTVLDKTFIEDEPDIEFEVRCTCRETATITIDGDGISASDAVSYEDASWNQDDEGDESDD